LKNSKASFNFYLHTGRYAKFLCSKSSQLQGSKQNLKGPSESKIAHDFLSKLSLPQQLYFISNFDLRNVQKILADFIKFLFIFQSAQKKLCL